MKISKHDITTIVIWSLVAYLGGTALASIFFDYIFDSTTALIIFLIPYSLIYGFCGFRTVNSLKGKTKLSWIKIVIVMLVILWAFGVLWRIAFLLIGYYPPGSGNVGGYIAVLAGGYLSYKNIFRK